MYDRRKKTQKKRSGVGMPAFVCILSAFALLFYAKAGGENSVRELLSRLAESPRFALSTMALETGVCPTPNNTGSISVYNPFAAAAGADAPLPYESEAAESGYIPTAEGQTEELTSGAKSEKVTINNATKLTYDIPSMLANPEVIHAHNDGPQVMIVHTHSTEAYAPDDQNPYTPSENDRTLDARYNVIRVGDEMAQVLESHGIETVHCREIFDNPAYNGSYDRSLTAIQEQIKKTPSIQIVIDVHRDSIIKEDGTEYKTSCEVDGKKMAQLMLVVGSNAGGLKHDNWERNLNYAVNLQSHIIEKYPTLMRSVNLRKQRFNQHMRIPGSMLIEVGSSGNTLTEAIDAAKIFAECLAEEMNA